MSRHNGDFREGQITFNDVQIGMTNRTAANAHSDLAAARIGQRNIREPERRVVGGLRGFEQQSAHGDILIR
jgi:hypothetical protein